MSEHFDVPFAWIEQAQQHLDRGRFARAVRAEQAKDFTAADLEIHIIDGARLWTAPEIFEDFRETADGDDYVGGLGRTSSGGGGGDHEENPWAMERFWSVTPLTPLRGEGDAGGQ